MTLLPEIRTILYTTALGEHTRPVFRYAVGLARRYNAEILIVHVVEPLSNTAKAVMRTYLSPEDVARIQKDDLQEVVEELKQRLQRFCDEELASAGSDESRVRDILVVAGDPGEEILRAAERYRADLIVLGRSTGPVYGNTVMGTVARRVTRLAPIPVFVVPNS